MPNALVDALLRIAGLVLYRLAARILFLMTMVWSLALLLGITML